MISFIIAFKLSRISSVLFFLFFSFLGFSQSTYQVLHYSETSGFDHATRVNSLSMFQGFQNLTVTDDQTGVNFNSLSNLTQYDLIVFSNTSGDAILDSAQRSHFEQYMLQGGNLIGIHAATDTYRHSTANGSKTGTWDFYAETLGGSVQQNPNHVAGTPAYLISKIGSHPTTLNLPDPWNKNEEYYYWENGYLDTAIQVVLNVETTVGPNNQINSYDSARAVSWYKELSGGSRIFYTSAGHANSNFTSDSLFIQHLNDAVAWCLRQPTSLDMQRLEKNVFTIYPNPSSNQLSVSTNEELNNPELIIHDSKGQVVLRRLMSNSNLELDVSGFQSGSYIITLQDGEIKNAQQLIID